MAGLELRYLGEFEVRRDGQVAPLPPSKKTRALLAYLSLHRRQFRREYLCNLLWEIPDDPRGSLRWSLSKLRRLIDDEDYARVVADRTNVGIDTSDLLIDVTTLHDLVANRLAEASIDELETAASSYRGNFLEGLEFSNFHDFHAWCVAEREQSIRSQSALLGELVSRLADSPEQAIPYARSLVGISPYDEAPRVKLIRLLNATKRVTEAEEQYQLGIRMLKEVGIVPSVALHAARRAVRIDAPRSVTRPQIIPEREPTRTQAHTLFGRDTEAQLLTSAWSRVLESGQAEMLLVRGAPGIGKSRVLEYVLEFTGQSEAFILQTAAFESDAIRPFAMWIDSLRKLQTDDVDEIFGGNDVSHRDRLFAGLSDLIARESATRPVVLVFDDMHWCDDSSAAALHYVARMNRNRPLLGVFAVRDDEFRDNASLRQAMRGLRSDKLLRQIKLGPLPEAALSQLIEEQAPGSDSGRVSGECGGNPLLAIELARAEKDGSSGGSLNELIHDRIAQFDVVGAEVLRWASVLGPRIDVATLVQLTGCDSVEVGTALESAERFAMLVSTDRSLRFSHDLIARAVYTEISPLRRQVMHRCVAEFLEQDAVLNLAHAADLVHHASQSQDAGLAARAMVSAGRLCLRFFANDEALNLARKGMQLVDQLPDVDRVCVSIDLHDVIQTAAPLENWEAAANEYVALAEKALDHGALSHARLGYHMASYLRWSHGHWSGAREESLQAERVSRGGSTAEHIVGMAETAKCLAMLERDLSQADAMLMEAQALAIRNRINHQAIAAGLGMLRYHENKFDEATELFKEARMLCKSAGDRINEFLANEYLMMIDFERGRFEDAKERCAELVEIADKLREGSEAPFSRALVALCDYVLDDEIEPFDAALEELRMVDAKARLAYTLTRVALIHIERGRTGNAIAQATEALQYAELLERTTEITLAHLALALAFQESGDEVRATEHLASIAAMDQSAVAAWARKRVEALTQRQGTEKA